MTISFDSNARQFPHTPWPVTVRGALFRAAIEDIRTAIPLVPPPGMFPFGFPPMLPPPPPRRSASAGVPPPPAAAAVAAPASDLEKQLSDLTLGSARPAAAAVPAAASLAVGSQIGSGATTAPA